MGVNVVIILTLLPALALLPKARAGCGNSARPDLCGGPPARAVPTATISCFEHFVLGTFAIPVKRESSKGGFETRPYKAQGYRPGLACADFRFILVHERLYPRNYVRRLRHDLFG